MRLVFVIFFIFHLAKPVLKSQVNEFIVLGCEWKDSLELTIKNNGKDTVYLFDGYLSNELRGNPYLKRFDLREDKYKLSYVPFSEYLHLVKSDRFILNQDKILVPFQITWSFMSIPPHSTKVLSFERSLVTAINEPMFLSFDTRNMIDKESLKTIPSDEMRIDTIHLELAFFQKASVDKLVFKKNKTYDEAQFKNARRTFFVKSIPVSLNF